jgi:hypothetical protein
MAEIILPFYESHRGAMEAAMRHRLDLAEAMWRERAHLSDIDGIRWEVMDEFEIVLTLMPYVGGAASRMSDFFMRLMGFMAISRVLRRHGVPLSVIGDIERETYKAQLLTVPEAERLAPVRQFLSPENQALVREQAAISATESHRKEFPEDFVYDFVEPGPGDNFEFGINDKACGFCKSRLTMETRKSCRTSVGLIRRLCNARHPPGQDTNVGWRREPLQLSILAAPVEPSSADALDQRSRQDDQRLASPWRGRPLSCRYSPGQTPPN